MKRIGFVLMLLTLTTLASRAQNDDMYFVPKKSKDMPAMKRHSAYDRPVYYAGSDRDVDEYNRHGRFRSSYQRLGNDSTANDVIDFSGGNGIYTDSTYLDSTTVYYSKDGYDGGSYYDDDEYRYCRRMHRFDGWYDPFYASSYYLYGPAYWRSAWYGGWYDPWYYDPWMYSYYGWGYPYYSSYYWGGWGYPHYWGGPVVAYRRGHTGTLGYYDRSHYAGGVRRDNSGSRRDYASGYARGNSNTSFGTRRSTTSAYGNQNSFGNVRYSQPSSPSFSRGSASGGFSGGGSFGGSRGGGVGTGGGGVRMGRR